MTPIFPDWYCCPPPPYGMIRRNAIKSWFEAHPEGRLAVNCKYRPQLQHDTDLGKLLKQGVLKRERPGRPGKQQFKHVGNYRTYLVKA